MSKPEEFPEQHQEQQPGKEHKMRPEPEVIRDNYRASDRLQGKTALITGGDSGIGRSVAVHYAREGANVAIVYLSEDKDAEETKELVEKAGRECLLLKGDLKNESFSRQIVKDTVEHFGDLNILVNNAAMQWPKDSPEKIDPNDFRKTFETNIYPYFYTVQEALEHLGEGDTIINTTSVVSYVGHEVLLDYSSTKGAITSFTRSLAKMLAEKKIRVNGVAPGPIWTPLIPATFEEEMVAQFGQNVPLGRAGQPSEVAPAYVFLATQDSSYMTGQILHVDGGMFVGG